MADDDSDVMPDPDALTRDSMMLWENGHARNYSIIQGSVALVSLASSSLLIWILRKSPKRFSTTYHRLLLGMSFADILLSLYLATFGVTAPRELSYIVWNARGNVATCDATGFIAALGGISGLLYTCSLNIYYLKVVRYQKSDAYIKRRLEPWLHAVPISFALVISIYFLVIDGMNADLLGRCSFTSPVDYPHCIGYEEGDTPEGFEIPCGRGGGDSARVFRFIIGLVIFLIVPVIVGVSLFLIYRSVSKQQKMSRYGRGAIDVSQGHSATQDQNTGVLSDEELVQSRAVMHRAFAYSVSYLLTWSMTLLGGLAAITGASISPQGQIISGYFYSFLHPLQGLFTLLIFMHPQVVHERRNGNISWFKAFAKSIWSAVTGRKASGVSVEQISATFSNETSDNIIDADCCLVTPPIEQKSLEEIRLEELHQNLSVEQETPTLQCSIPLATVAPVDVSDTVEGDRAEHDYEGSESLSIEGVDAEASRNAASLPDIDPKLRSIMEEHDIPVATLERNDEESDDEESDESLEDDLESFDTDRMTRTLSEIGFIPDLPSSLDHQH